jgi:hypothetical protein
MNEEVKTRVDELFGKEYPVLDFVDEEKHQPYLIQHVPGASLLPPPPPIKILNPPPPSSRPQKVLKSSKALSEVTIESESEEEHLIHKRELEKLKDKELIRGRDLLDKQPQLFSNMDEKLRKLQGQISKNN